VTQETIRFSLSINPAAKAALDYCTTTYQEEWLHVTLHGLEAQFNSNAIARLIVMHGANYVSSASIKVLGRLGRSWGCPAVRPAIAKELIDNIKEDRFMFIYYPDQEWLQSSTYLHCSQ
jgi:hypothetical protein